MHDLDDVWRDDQLIEALANGEPVDTTDPAAAPLRALTGLVDAAPIPDYDVRGLENLVPLDTGRSHRVAVRSLAVALTAVATLSTSGVAAVVTGDPFQPAKLVWHQIQERAGDRWGAGPASDEPRLGSGAAVGGDAGDTGTSSDDAGTDGTGTAAQAAVFEAARQGDGPTRLHRVALPGHSAEEKDGLEAGQAPSRDRAVAEADGTDERSPAREDQEDTAEERPARQEERASETETSEDSAQQREKTQRSQEDQETQDSRRSDQPEEGEQEPTPDAPADDLDPGVLPDSLDEDPGDSHGSLRSTEDSDEADDDAEESDEAEEDAEESGGATVTDPVPGEDTPSTEEPTAEESEGDEPWAKRYVEQRAGSTDETVAPPRLNR